MSRILVIGAGGGIGLALVQAKLNISTNSGVFAESSNTTQQPSIIAVSHQPESSNISASPSQLQWLQVQYTPEAIQQLVQQWRQQEYCFEQVFICCGVLHGEAFQPEKRLEDIQADVMAQVYYCNTILPSLWVQALLPCVKSANKAVVSVFSARVGSISDNRLGGWYSYRASKAALNMMLQTAAIEYRRRAPKVKLLAFHPGSTDTALSKPFQRRVPPGQLKTPAEVAECLLTIVERLPADGELAFLDWQGKPIAF